MRDTSIIKATRDDIQPLRFSTTGIIIYSSHHLSMHNDIIYEEG